MINYEGSCDGQFQIVLIFMDSEDISNQVV